MEQLPHQPTPKLRLLRTKYAAPHAHPDLVPRARLLNKLDQGGACPLTVVAAPAGFGKTTLISAWVQNTQAAAAPPGALPASAGQATWPSPKVAWVSLDAGDNDPARFWAYVVAALQSALGPRLGEQALALLTTPQPPPLEALLGDLLNEIALAAQPCRLILDDYHVIDNGDIHHGLNFLLQNLPDELRLVIAGRQTPPLELARLRARRQLVELGPQDLRFTPDEAAAFLNQVMNLGLTGGQAASLAARTEGWAAGLQLAALSMQGVRDVNRFVRAFSGSQRFVFDYLAQEVLARQPAQVRAFLLRTSVLERLCGELCEALGDDSGAVDGQEMLEHLEWANLFVVPLDQERRWYRYHHLFGDFLRARLAQQMDAAAVADLHRRAAGWFAGQGLAEEALKHTLAAGDFERAAVMMAECAPELFRRSALVTLVQWCRSLPADLWSRLPALNMCYAWALLATGQHSEVADRLTAIEQAMGAHVEALAVPDAATLSPGVRAALVEIATLRSNLAFHQFDLGRAAELARLALANLPAGDSVMLYNTAGSLRPAIVFTLALAQEFSGETQAAVEVFRQAARLADEQKNYHLLPTALGHLAQLEALQGRLRQAAVTYKGALTAAASGSGRPTPMSGMAHAGLGLLLYEWNDLAGAAVNLQAAVATSRVWRNWEGLAGGYLGLARVCRAAEDWAGATAALAELAALVERFGLPALIMPSIAAARARLAGERGDLAAAGHWAAGCGLGVEDDVPYPREGEALVLARVLLAQGRLAEAEELLDGLLARAEAGGRLGRAIEILALQALVYEAADRPAAAAATLLRALELAQPEDYVRSFVDEGAPMAHLIGRLRKHSYLPPKLHAYSDRLAAAFAASAPAGSLNSPGPSGADTSAGPTGSPFEHGEAAVSPSAPPPLRSPAPPLLPEPLSPREHEVLLLLAQGLGNQEIAARLVVSLNTVKTHLKTIYAKLGVTTRTQAIARARELGLS